MPSRFIMNRSYSATPGNSLHALLKPYRFMIMVLIILALASNGLNLLIPLVIADGIDGIAHGRLNLNPLILKFIMAALGIFILTYLQGILQTWVSELAAMNLRKRLSEKIASQSFAYIQQANASRLLTNMTSDVDSIKVFISQAMVSIVSSMFIIAGVCVMLISIQWKLALIVITVIPLVGSAFFVMFRKAKVLFKKSREVVDWLNRVINESVLGAMLVRVLNAQQIEYQKFMEANITSREIGLSILGLFAALIPVITFVSNLAMLAVLYMGGHFVISQSMSLGDLAAFNSFISILIFPILIIGFMSNVIAQAKASHQRILEVLDATEIKQVKSAAPKLTGQLRLQNIQLTYGEKAVLRNVNISIVPGSRTAILGPTAAGKTQLLYIMTGLTQQDSGTIIYDHVSLENIDPEQYYKQIGIVFQDSAVFQLSVRENVAFTDSVTEEAMEKAIRASELTTFVNSLPNQLDTIMTERGTSLSGGQKQRLMLARALAHNPSILFLDDFTSKLDKRTEHKIMDNLTRLYPHLTIVSIMQRIRPIENYDQIILIMEGEIVASGNHSYLLRNSPEYVQIYHSQRSISHYEL
jgi:ATP-binding cassette subfamily B protein